MNYRNPIYTENGAIDCEIEHPDYGWIPFTASPDDCEEHGRELFKHIKANDKVAAYVPPPPPTPEQLAAQARAQRDSLLASTDWTQLPDVTDATREAYAVYRQALRDVPLQDGYPETIEWPTLGV